jgi:hypothetical protein
MLRPSPKTFSFTLQHKINKIVCHLSKILLKNDHSSLKFTCVARQIVDAPKKQETREKRQQRARGFNQ